MESLIASGVLAAIVLAVGAAVSAAQMASFEGQKLILGTMAADDYLSELVTVSYASMNAHAGVQPIGGMTTIDGVAYPNTYWAIGRAALVENTSIEEPGTGAVIHGKRLVVWTYDESRMLAIVETFVAEPM